ncbi:lipocalin family protein [Chryseosolibacter indicus]|uniref:Lipocalin family protein n=1 Tax=Chryseosolibacter indicus TaxID=2782351 RepID=A0ABS5VPH3_9BACT|nr:lipocalin family protein [Chryseosolibacter indicus]MBT1703345.1 lipocalin family protein [Chryseosolibacter indicus]
MKISKLLLIALVTILFACKEDDDEPKITGQQLVGSWEVTAINYEGTSTTVTQGVEMEMNFTGRGKDMDLLVTFNEGPATYKSEGDYTIELTYSLQGQSFELDTYFEGFLADGTWLQDGKTLIVNGPGGIQKATIIELTSTTLKMEYDFTHSLSQQGSTSVMDIHGTYTFKKK